MTKTALAKLLGISENTLGRYERDETRPAGVAVRKTAAAFIKKHWGVLRRMRLKSMKRQ